MMHPIMLIDLLAVLAPFSELPGLRALRLLRLLRTTQVFRYRNPFAIMFQAFEGNSLMTGLQRSKQGGLVIGLGTPSGEAILNPPKSHQVMPQALLLYMAEQLLLTPPR